MSEEIQEIPLDIEDITEKIESIEDSLGAPPQSKATTEKSPQKIEDRLGAPPQSPPLDAPAIPVPEAEEPPVRKAKAKGRPKGALNKAPSKPRAKKKAPPIREVAAQEEEDDPIEFGEEYVPSSPRRRRIGDGDLSTEMFRLLRLQQNSRIDRKRQLYASWFQ